MGKESMDVLWHDKKRFLGLPISFTKYKLSEDRLFLEKGIFTSVYDEILLYRVTDLTLKRTLWQKMFGVGTVIVVSSDKSQPILELKNIKNSFDVKELIHRNVEKAKKERRMRVEEVIDNDDEENV